MAVTGQNYVLPGLAAGSDLSAKQFFLGNIASDGAVDSAAAGKRCDGVIYNKPAAAEAVELVAGGRVKYIAGGTISAGDYVTADSAGEGVVAYGDDFKAIYALEAATDGDIVEGVWLGGIGHFPERETPQTLTGAGAVNVTSKVTWVVTTGANALTLAAGVEGQEKFIVMKTDGGDGTLTPAALGNGTTITFDDAGDSAHLVYTNSAWYFMGGTATLA